MNDVQHIEHTSRSTTVSLKNKYNQIKIALAYFIVLFSSSKNFNKGTHLGITDNSNSCPLIQSDNTHKLNKRPCVKSMIKIYILRYLWTHGWIINDFM